MRIVFQLEYAIAERQSAKIVSDSLIAAAAIEHPLPLYTLDVTRFAAVTGLNALRPY